MDMSSEKLKRNHLQLINIVRSSHIYIDFEEEFEVFEFEDTTDRKLCVCGGCERESLLIDMHCH